MLFIKWEFYYVLLRKEGEILAETKKELLSSKKIKCLNCRKIRSSSSFYVNSNPLFSSEKFEICKSCINEYIGEKEANYLNRVISVLAMIDKPFIEDLWISRGEEWSRYIPQLSSFPKYKDMKFSDSDNYFIQSNTHADESEYIDEERHYNKKWMGEYTASDIDYLEEYYTGLDRDFKIVTTNHKDYAKKICKASLHMDKCFQDVLNGVSGADSKYKSARETFDTLSKSAQFSESQRGQNDVGLGCFGVTFDQVEQRKWVPKHIPMDKDSIDKMIDQFASIKESV